MGFHQEGRSSARLWRLPSWLLNQAASCGNRLVRDHLGDLARRAPYAVLAGLDEFGHLSQAELVRRTGIDRSDMVAVVNQLERDGLASRRPDRTDKRRNSIRITAAGRRHLAKLDVQVGDAQTALLEPLTAEEQQQLIALLHRLLEHHAGPSGVA